MDVWFRGLFYETERRLLMDETTKEEYVEKLCQLLLTVDDTYKLRFFYIFVRENLESNN